MRSVKLAIEQLRHHCNHFLQRLDAVSHNGQQGISMYCIVLVMIQTLQTSRWFLFLHKSDQGLKAEANEIRQLLITSVLLSEVLDSECQSEE